MGTDSLCPQQGQTPCNRRPSGPCDAPRGSEWNPGSLPSSEPSLSKLSVYMVKAMASRCLQGQGQAWGGVLWEPALHWGLSLCHCWGRDERIWHCTPGQLAATQLFMADKLSQEAPPRTLDSQGG